MVLAFDSKGIVNYANAGAKEKLGYGEEIKGGKGLRNYIQGDL